MEKNRTKLTVAFLTIPALVFCLIQAGAAGLLIWRWSDAPVPAWAGSVGLGVGLTAFILSAPALALISRSEIGGLTRYLLMAVHGLWFVSGGLILLAGLVLEVFPWIERWISR